MKNGLNRRQLQETLREMGVEFPTGASREDLKDILDQANQKQWLRVARRGSTGGGGRIIRRKGGNPRPIAAQTDPPPDTASPKEPLEPAYGPKFDSAPWEKNSTPPEAEPKSGEKPRTPVFDRTKDLEAYALSRAKGVCDLCEKCPDQKNDGQPTELKPCFFIDPPDEKPHTFKTVAALCPDCFERVSAEPAISDIRLLKRKARQTRAGRITVTTKKKPPVPRKVKHARYRKQRPSRG